MEKDRSIRTQKDALYDLLNSKTRECFRQFMQSHTGEYNDIDFKVTWVEQGKLAKIMLAMVNSGGGFIVAGINDIFEPIGLSKIWDKADIHNSIKKFIPEELKYDVYDFVYDSSEYEKLQGKNFQVLEVFANNAHIPLFSRTGGSDIEKDCLYIRRATKTEKANSSEIQEIINSRIKNTPFNADIPLKDQLDQLKVLYNAIPPKIKEGSPLYKQLILSHLQALSTVSLVESENPDYPAESYDKFIRRMIDNKKLKIAKDLGL